MNRTISSQDNNSLSVIRGLAIIFVLICHFSLENEYFRAHNLTDPFFSGTVLFFLISGYGIAASVLSRPFHVLAYFKRRIQKIYPSLLLALAICFLVNIWFNLIDIGEYMAAIFVKTNTVQLKESLKVLMGIYHIRGGGGGYIPSALIGIWA